MSMGDIAKLFNCSRVYIMLLLKKYNLPIRSKSVARGEAKKKGKNVGFSSINEKFFKEQTPEMAYVLGFIYSDGNIGNQHNHFSIAQKEPEILYKIKDLMSSEHQIIRKNNQDIYVLTVGNKIMVDDLLSLGLTPNKSLDAKFPALRKDLYCHFIRGYFDGDGSICLSNKTWRINFTSGSRDFLIGLEEVMASCTGCTRKPVYISFKTKERKLVYSKKSDLTMIYNYFYDEITRMKGIFLDRKHELFKQSVDQNGIKDY